MSTELVSKARITKIPDVLVAPIESQDVPNHLLNTKIYAKLERNEIFEVSPVEVHFAGFEISDDEVKKFKQILKIINISDQVQRMTVLPPKTKYFDIYYVKPDRLVPGFALEIQITFKPDEYKYYNDAIRIHSKGEENLIVPIHAYPIISSFNFPTEYKFPNTEIGKSVTRSFSMRSTAPIEFEFMVEVLQKHSAFVIDPLDGVIPFNNDSFINVTFSPKEYCTAIMVVQLVVSQFNAKPIICRFYGTCLPGIAAEKVLNSWKPEDAPLSSPIVRELSRGDDTVDPRMLSPLHLSRVKRKIVDYASESSDHSRKEATSAVSDEIEIEGFRFPKKLNSVWAFSKVLNQTKGKLKLKELKSQSQAVSRQHKEAVFMQKVLELEDEERRNQLKWQVKLGETSIDYQSKQEILISRAQAEYQYKLSVGEPVIEDELNRKESLYKQTRTFRFYNQECRKDIKFDFFKNEMWQLKHYSIARFIQAGRKVIILNRLKIRLNLLKAFTNEWIQSKTGVSKIDSQLTLEGFVEQYQKIMRGENIEQDIAVTSLNAKSLGTYYFPRTLESTNSSNDTQLDALGLVAVKPIEFSIDTKIPYNNLSIAKQYQLYGYKPIRDSEYVPKFENRIRKLRKGAEDELIQVDSHSHKAVTIESPMRKPTTTLQKTELQMESSTVVDSSISEVPQVIDFQAPSYFMQQIEYPPMYIFNPAPGLISYEKPMPYSAVELNHNLNPLPRFEKDQAYSTQKKYLDREDVIKGVMSWKKFPSQGLISLSNTPTLTDVWVPRWSNVFGSDLLPLETPPLLSGLPEDDKENLLEDTEFEIERKPSDSKCESSQNPLGLLNLTPDMVNAQFNIPNLFDHRQQSLKEELSRRKKSKFYQTPQTIKLQFPHSNKLPITNLPVNSEGPVLRDQREQELEYFLNKQYNDLGLRIKSKLQFIQTGNITPLQQQLDQSNYPETEPNQTKP